jgi:predicted dithiol-disulfide oxidoreductase (DUF899 family)
MASRTNVRSISCQLSSAISQAAQRRTLPPGGEISEDYMFEEGEDGRPIRMSQLFAGKPTLIAYSFMYGPKMDHACPACTSILNALDGETRHVTQRTSLVVIAKSPSPAS